MREQFGIDDWNRGSEDEGQPLRAIIKDYIRFRTPFGRKNFSTMRRTVEKLNEMGIYNMDLRESNYLGGRLFDFSVAITSPHLSLWPKLRTREQVLEDMDYDLLSFDEMVQKVEADQKEAREQSLGRLRSRRKKTTGATR
jgi:hypothetical protein